MNYYAHYRKGRECGVNGIRNAISNFCAKTDVFLWIFFCIFALHDINIIFPDHAVFTRCLLWLAHQKAKVFYSTDLQIVQHEYQLLHVFCYHFDTLCLCFYHIIRIICALFHFSINRGISSTIESALHWWKRNCRRPTKGWCGPRGSSRVWVRQAGCRDRQRWDQPSRPKAWPALLGYPMPELQIKRSRHFTLPHHPRQLLD